MRSPRSAPIVAAIAAGLLGCPSPGPSSASAVEPSAPSARPSRPAPRCEADRAMGRTLPRAASVVATHVTTLEGAPVPVEEVRAALETASLVDPCDPTQQGWSYAPRASGALTTEAGRVELTLFHGQRAAVTWPDGARVVFDHGARR